MTTGVRSRSSVLGTLAQVGGRERGEEDTWADKNNFHVQVANPSGENVANYWQVCQLGLAMVCVGGEVLFREGNTAGIVVPVKNLPRKVNIGPRERNKISLKRGESRKFIRENKKTKVL